MYCFTSLTVEFEDAEFQSDLRKYDIATRYIEESPQGFPEYEYIGSRAALENLIDKWFGNEPMLLESIQQA